METQFDIVYFPVRNKAAAILSPLNDVNNNYAATDVDIDALANDLIAVSYTHLAYVLRCLPDFEQRLGCRGRRA